jgi:hypothetical protein
MEGFLRRIKAVHSAKKAEAAPAEIKPVETPKAESSEEGLSRRDFFKRYAAPAAATVALSAIPTVLQTELAEAAASTGPESIKRREAAIGNLLNEIRRKMNSPEVKSAMAGEGEYLVTRMLSALTTPLTQEMLRGTKYDVEKFYKKYYMQIATEKLPNGKRDTHINSALTGRIVTDRTRGPMGSGAFVGAQNRFLTAQHVLDGAMGTPHSRKGPDIAFLNTGDVKAHPEQVLRMDPTLRDEDIDGQLVYIFGSDGKIYPVVPMKMHRKMVEQVYVNDSPEQRDRLARSFVVQLPPGEAEGAKVIDKPVTGSSGGVVVMFRGENAEPEACGLLHSDLPIPDPASKRTVSTGYIYGPTELNKVHQDFLRSGV